MKLVFLRRGGEGVVEFGGVEREGKSWKGGGEGGRGGGEVRGGKGSF